MWTIVALYAAALFLFVEAFQQPGPQLHLTLTGVSLALLDARLNDQRS